MLQKLVNKLGVILMNKAGSLKLFFLFIVMCLSGCRNTSTQTDEMEGIVESNMNLTVDSSQYISMEEAHNEVENLQGKLRYGFQFPDQILMPRDDVISVIKLQPYYIKEKDILQTTISQMWSGYNSIDWSNAQIEQYTREFDEKYFGVGVVQEDSDSWYSYDTEGFLCWYALDDSELTMSNCIRTYDFQWKDNLEFEIPEIIGIRQ